jgi:hypothetical protein
MYEEQRRVCRFHAERCLKARAENRVFRSGNLKGGFSLKKNHTINREIATNDTKKIGSCVVSPKNLLGNFKLFLKILFHV